MRPTRLAIPAALVCLAFHAAPALAQAPGHCDCEVAPVVVVAPAPSQGWQGQRFGVGLRLSSISLSPENDPDRTTEFAGGGLQLRYRLNARWELEGALDGGREQLEDGTEGSTHLSMFTASVLFHLRPYRRWDVYAIAGIGGAGAHSEGMDPDDGAQLSHVALGLGVERRFRRLGLAAELRMIGMQPAEPDDAAAPAGRPDGMALVPVDGGAADDDGIAGGQLSLVANYYF